MILLQRKVFPRPGRPTRIMISFCLSTRFLFRTFPGLQGNVCQVTAIATYCGVA